MAIPGDFETRMRVLEDVEAIKRLKARYWRCMDQKLWAEMEQLYTDDATQEAGDWRVEGGGRAIVRRLSQVLDGVATAHGGHSPDIEITGDTTARGTWALQDRLVWKSGRKMTGFGHYEDEYVKEQGAWRIRSTRITRLFEEWA